MEEKAWQWYRSRRAVHLFTGALKKSFEGSRWILACFDWISTGLTNDNDWMPTVAFFHQSGPVRYTDAVCNMS
jgi:hypothetical protein